MTHDPAGDTITCLICGSGLLTPVAKPASVQKGVTSDCKEWPGSGALLVCESCGHVQKNVDGEWQRNASAIYAAYNIYHLSAGAEQVVFQGAEPIARSARLLGLLQTQLDLPQKGHLLDVGCGNGAMLRSASQILPQWELAGHELNDTFRAEVEGIPNVTRFYSGALAEIQETYELITLLHVLEHVIDAVEFVQQLRKRLVPGGHIVIEVPYFPENPFDLVVADHCSHFIPETLTHLAQRAGMEVVMATTSWLPKENSIILRDPISDSKSEPVSNNYTLTLRTIKADVSWLGNLVEQALTIGPSTEIGIFGTALGGTWLGGTLGPDRFGFFVDEDSQRVGKLHLGKTVMRPADVPAGKIVLLALPPPMAQRTYHRLHRDFPSVDFILPPALQVEPPR